MFKVDLVRLYLIITIIAVSKIKEKYIQEGIDEYIKRLSAYCTLKIKEVEAQKVKVSMPIEKVKELEAHKIQQNISSDACVIALDERGKQFTSCQFAEFINYSLINSGKSEICFLIGGANGLSADLLKQADYSCALSKMTFPHQLARLITLEQIYRGFRINNNEPYHK